MSKISKYLKITNYLNKLKYYGDKFILSPIIKYPLLKLGFMNYSSIHIHGPKNRLIYDTNYPISLVNTIFNTRSGKIELGKYVLFGHNCMVLTGKHNYLDALQDIKKIYEVPIEGRDIKIGDGTWITSGCIILGG